MQRLSALDRGRRQPGEVGAPVFLLGAPRSGTSLLYKVLCLHPEAAWISNWVRTVPSAPALAALNRLAVRMPELQRGAWFASDSNAYVYGRRRPVWERAFPTPVEGEPIFKQLATIDDLGSGSSDEPHRQERHLAVLRARVRSITRFGKGSVFINKRIANNRRIRQLVTAFPAARFVDLVRDGRAVAYSLSRVDWWPKSTLWWLDRTPERWQAEGGDPWELCARSWVEEVGAIERGLGEVPSDRLLRLSYEELVASPIESVRHVGAFAGLPGDEGWLDRLSRLRFPDRNERWRRSLRASEVSTIEAIQGDTLRRYGYAA